MDNLIILNFNYTIACYTDMIINEPTHEIMALIALRKLNLQTRMRSNPLGLHD